MIAQTVFWVAVCTALLTLPVGAGVQCVIKNRKRRRGATKRSVDDWGRLERPATSTVATLRADARAGRRHADEFGLPYAVWDLLEAFWSLDDEEPEPGPKSTSDCRYCGVPTYHGRQLCRPCSRQKQLRVRKSRCQL